MRAAITVSTKRAFAGMMALAVVCAAGLYTSDAACGAEFQLRPQCACRSTVVTLGDVAEVFSADPRQAAMLAAIELFPAPPANQPRFVRVREIQDALLTRGVNLAEHQFSGASQVMVGTQGGVAESDRPVSPADAKRAVRLLHDAMLKYLQQQSAPRDASETEFRLTDAQTRAVLKAAARLAIGGGQAPWVGVQRLQVTAASVEGAVQFPLEVNISSPPVVAVAAHLLSRGAVVRPEDVVLTSTIPAAEQGDVLHSLEDVVGRELTRAVPEGHPIDRPALRAPVTVRRGDVVTVYARSAGIRVRTLARAREEGGQGDLICVESLQDRKTYFARVSGTQEVEVYSRAAQAVEPASESAARLSSTSSAARAGTLRR